MKPLSERIDTVILVMLENRSFDHLLGHLTYERLMADVDGLEQDLAKYANPYGGRSYQPFQMPDRPLAYDLPHEWNEVDVQLARSAVTETYDMNGFVEAYAASTGTKPKQKADPMGFFPSKTVPISSFLARSFCVCDRWHCPLPTSTQPNRTMAFSGSSRIADTGGRLIPCDGLLFDWLEEAKVRWRVYHDGLSFFALYRRAWPYVLSERFRDFEYFFHDMQTEPLDQGPQVIVVEPSYNDGPHIGPDHPNDNHPPLAIGWGEDFLRRTYQAATVNSERWEKTVLVYYYDEHGGFHDHVAPPSVRYVTTGAPAHTFESLGPRVPAVVMSPLVGAGTVSHALFDHTSVLQLLAERFTPGKPYSADVEQRRQDGITSLSDVLGDTPRTDIPPAPSAPIAVESALGQAVRVRPDNPMQASFELAASEMMVAERDKAAQKYPELFQWKAAVDAERRKVPGE
jgi:phospholipase C